MAMLDRYRKTGGFVQLLSLLETCVPSKQEKFLEIIRAEDPRWSDAIKKRMLTIDRVYSWPNDTLAEIFGTLQDLTVAVALVSATPEMKQRIYGYFSHARQRKIDDMIVGAKPSPAEVLTTNMKIIEAVRKMVVEGYIRIEKVDPDLAIDEDIEDHLAKAPIDTASIVGDSNVLNFGAHDVEVPVVEKSDGSSTAVDQQRLAELLAVKKKLAEVAQENAQLRHELSIARTKLEQIKKIA